MTYISGLVLLDERLVDVERAGARGEAQHEGPLGRRVELLDALNDVVGDVVAGVSCLVANDDPHCRLSVLEFDGYGCK